MGKTTSKGIKDNQILIKKKEEIIKFEKRKKETRRGEEKEQSTESRPSRAD